MACLLFSHANAYALLGDRLTPFIEESVTYDANLFRISKDVDPATAFGTGSKSDTIRTTLTGIKLDAPINRQRVQASFVRSSNRFDRFKDLDYTGHDARAFWLWQVGSQLSGQLGYSDRLALASFADFPGRTADYVKTRQAVYGAVYDVGPHWRVQLGASALRQSNSDPARQSNDVDIYDSDATLSYITRSGNSLGIATRVEKGRFPNMQTIGGTAVDNAYGQHSLDCVGDWGITALSHLSWRIGRVSRRFEQLPQRDFDGNTAHIRYDWKPTGKLEIAAIAQKDISAYEDFRANFVVVKGIALRPTFHLSGKFDVSGNLDYSSRDFLGDPGLVSSAAPKRSDRVRTVGLIMTYRPARNVTLQFGSRRESRSSNVVFIDYATRVSFVSLRIGF